MAKTFVDFSSGDSYLDIITVDVDDINDEREVLYLGDFENLEEFESYIKENGYKVIKVNGLPYGYEILFEEVWDLKYIDEKDAGAFNLFLENIGLFQNDSEYSLSGWVDYFQDIYYGETKDIIGFYSECIDNLIEYIKDNTSISLNLSKYYLSFYIDKEGFFKGLEDYGVLVEIYRDGTYYIYILDSVFRECFL